jgi:hypothetical protein
MELGASPLPEAALALGGDGMPQPVYLRAQALDPQNKSQIKFSIYG